jgi:hypothetical protein
MRFVGGLFSNGGWALAREPQPASARKKPVLLLAAYGGQMQLSNA